LQKGQVAIKAYLKEQERLFYSGQLTNPDWTKGGVNWDAFIKSYEDLILEEAGKEALIDTAYAKLKEKYPDMKIDKTTIKRAIGISTGKDEGQTFADGWLGSVKESNLPVAATAVIAEQAKTNQKAIYAAGSAGGTIYWKGFLEGADIDMRTAIVKMLAGPVADEILSRKNRTGGGEQQ